MARRSATTLSLTEIVVLGLVVEQPRHGFAVARELRADGGIGQVWTVHRPLVYRAIDRLEQAGLVAATRTEPGDQGPHRTVYRATRTGRARCREWLARPVAHPRDARAELLVKFLFLARDDQPLRPLAEAQLEQFRQVAEGLEQTVDDATGADRLVALWRLETVQATNSTLRRIVSDEPATPRASTPRRRHRDGPPCPGSAPGHTGER
jgi:DNA-binding PadR family transcriptional regulator